MVTEELSDFMTATMPTLSLLVPGLRRTKRRLEFLAQSAALHTTSFILALAVADWETEHAFYF